MNEQPTEAQVHAQNAQAFLQRADLKGAEVDNYAKCFNFLAGIADGSNVIVAAKLWEAGQKAMQDHITPSEEDTSDGEEMVSEGGPAPELNDVD